MTAPARRTNKGLPKNRNKPHVDVVQRWMGEGSKEHRKILHPETLWKNEQTSMYLDWNWPEGVSASGQPKLKKKGLGRLMKDDCNRPEVEVDQYWKGFKEGRTTERFPILKTVEESTKFIC